MSTNSDAGPTGSELTKDVEGASREPLCSAVVAFYTEVAYDEFAKCVDPSAGVPRWDDLEAAAKDEWLRRGRSQLERDPARLAEVKEVMAIVQPND